MSRAILSALLLGTAASTACSSGAAAPLDLESVDLGPRSALSDEEASSRRAACAFSAGSLPGLTLARDAPLGPEIPIDTIVVVILENRSFDHLMSRLPALGQKDGDVGTLLETNPDPNGQPVARFHLTDVCIDDPNHGWSDAHLEWNNGKMDGFVVHNEENNGASADGRRAMGYHTEEELPFLYGVASRFAVADRYFSPLLGPTFPNREYAYAATSFGNTGNDLFSDHRLNIFEALQTAGVSWHVYSEQYPGSAIFLDTYTHYLSDHYDHFAQFLDDARAGTLAHVVYVDPNLRPEGGRRDDFHTPGDAQLGDAFIERVVRAILESPQWSHAAIFITFDEHGGFYDHVPPPPACAPDDKAPRLAPGESPGGFDRYGVRVPAIVISPYARKQFVSHRIYDHTSILRFIETRFVLPSMSARDANADPMLDMFDFARPSFAVAPRLPSANVDPIKQAACAAKYPNEDLPDLRIVDGGTD